MSFDYTPMTEEECEEARKAVLLQDGVYDFIVAEAKFQYSQSNNAMIQLKLLIVSGGQEYTVYDNLIATPKMMWKLRHFCETTQLEEEYNQKLFNDRLCIRKTGQCIVASEPERPRTDGKPGVYKAKNTVTDYVGHTLAGNAEFAGAIVSSTPPKAELGDLNDDVSF